MNTNFVKENDLKLKIDSSQKNKYDELFTLSFKSSKLTSVYIMLVFLDLLIAYQEATAAQVKEIFDDVLPSPIVVNVNSGNLYPTVHEMLDNGYIEYKGHGNNNAKFYSITKKGKKYYETLKQEIKDEIKESKAFYTEFFKLIYN